MRTPPSLTSDTETKNRGTPATVPSAAVSAEQLVATAADGTRLAVTVSGAGRPLLMIPGLGSARRVYDPLVGLLVERCRTIVYDQRGVGDSDASEGPYTMSQLAAD